MDSIIYLYPFLVRECSIRTRIKTNRDEPVLDYFYWSESVPLEQGLRQQNIGGLPLRWRSESVPLEQGLRPVNMVQHVYSLLSESVPLENEYTNQSPQRHLFQSRRLIHCANS